MQKKLVFLFILFLILSANAVEIESYDSDTDEDAELTPFQIEILTKLSSLDAKVNNLPNNEAVQGGFVASVNHLQAVIDENTDFLILAILMGIIFLQTIAVTIFLILLGKRHIPNIFNKEDKGAV